MAVLPGRKKLAFKAGFHCTSTERRSLYIYGITSRDETSEYILLGFVPSSTFEVC